MIEVVICSAVRTAIGNFFGALSSLSATELGGIVIEEAVKRALARGGPGGGAPWGRGGQSGVFFPWGGGGGWGGASWGELPLRSG